MNYFIDRNLSIYLAKAISALCEPENISVKHLDEIFPKNTPDIDWIKKLSEDGDWAVITQDRLTRNSIEREALRSTGLLTFMLAKGWAHQKEWDKAAALIRWWPRLMETASLISSGAFLVPYKFSGKGKLEQVKL